MRNRSSAARAASGSSAEAASRNPSPAAAVSAWRRSRTVSTGPATLRQETSFGEKVEGPAPLAAVHTAGHLPDAALLTEAVAPLEQHHGVPNGRAVTLSARVCRRSPR